MKQSGRMASGSRLRGLYVLADDDRHWPHGPLAQARAACAAGAAVVQLRAKHATDRETLALATEIRRLTAASGLLFFVNDRFDLALLCGADGVHLGQDDLPLAAARALGPDLLVGISTHDPEQARAAVAGGADYVGCGPVFATTTKPGPDPIAGLAGLGAVCAAVRVPVVAIGGITLANAPAVLAAGAAAVAVISAVNYAPDVVAAGRSLVAAWAAGARR